MILDYCQVCPGFSSSETQLVDPTIPLLLNNASSSLRWENCVRLCHFMTFSNSKDLTTPGAERKWKMLLAFELALLPHLKLFASFMFGRKFLLPQCSESLGWKAGLILPFYYPYSYSYSVLFCLFIILILILSYSVTSRCIDAWSSSH